MLKTLGGDRLGAGKKMKVELHNYERSTHDLGYIWRSTMSAGTLVPFMTQVATGKTSGGQAPSGGGEILAAQAMGLQLKMQEAQIKRIS